MSRSSSLPSFIGVVAAIVAALVVGAGLGSLGVSTSGVVFGGVGFVAVVCIAWAVFTSHSRPAVRQVLEQDVRRMESARMTPDEIARETGLEPYQVRRILAGDDGWWRKP
jgi:hypothetical protein